MKSLKLIHLTKDLQDVLKDIFNVTISSIVNFSRFEYPPSNKKWVEIRYVMGESVVSARLNTAQQGENILFPSFHVHEWLVVANRVKATNEKFVDQSEEYREGIHLQSF